jgi:transposase
MIDGYLGIDVSKEKLDVHLLAGGKSYGALFANKAESSVKLQRWVQTRVKGPVHACLESTGPYSYGPGVSLLDWCEVVSVENPRRIKNFGIALGVLTKTDKVDARIIAEYCKRMTPKPWRLMSAQARELLLLVRRLSDMETLVSMESNRLEDPHLPERVKGSILLSLEDLRGHRKRVRDLIKANLAPQDKLKEQIRTIALLPGMGEVSAVRYLAVFGGPENYDRAEAVPAYCGVYPVLNQSGKFKGRSTMSKCGEPLVRGMFHMGALAASRHDPLMKEFRQRLEARGLNPMAAIGACKRKLLMQCYGVLKALEEGREPTGINRDKRIKWDLTES